MAISTLVAEGVLIVETCCNCGTPFAMSQAIYDAALRSRGANGRQFYCPNGHAQHYTGKTAEQKLRDELETAQRRTIQERNWRQSAERATEREQRSKAAVKGHLTRMRNKVAAGVCPVPGCRRPFHQVREHLQTVHPAWLKEHDLEIDAL